VPAGPSVVDPNAWFSFAIQTEQDLASETTPSTPVPADEAIRTSAPSEEACCAPAAADLPTSTSATKILPPPIKEVPHLPAPAKETPCASAPLEAACRTSAPTEEVSRTSSSADAAHCSPVPADLAVPVALPPASVGVGMEPPSEAADPRGTVGYYPEGCPTRSNVRYVDKNNPETEVEDAPAENAAPAESPVPRAIPPAVTRLLTSEEEPPLSVDPPAPQTSSPVPLLLCDDRPAVCGPPKPDVSKDIQESQPPRLSWLSFCEAPGPGAGESIREARVLVPQLPTEPRKSTRPKWARRLRPKKPGTPASSQCLPGGGVILPAPLSHFHLTPACLPPAFHNAPQCLRPSACPFTLFFDFISLCLFLCFIFFLLTFLWHFILVLGKFPHPNPSSARDPSSALRPLMFPADVHLDLSDEPSVGFWVPFQPQKPVRTRHRLRTSYAQQRVSHPLLRNFWASPARLHICTTPPVVLGSYANPVGSWAPVGPFVVHLG